DGTSQPGYAGTPLIELDGSYAGTANGLTLYGSNITIEGVDIVRFSGAAVAGVGTGAVNDQIVSHDIRGDSRGTAGPSNGIAVHITDGAHDNIVGGTEPGLGNEIAYSSGSGIVVQGDDSLGNRISGNRIVASGAADLKFDGTGGDVQLPSFPVGGAMTFEAW